MNEGTRATWRTYVGGNPGILPRTIGRFEANGTRTATIGELTVQENKENLVAHLVKQKPCLDDIGQCENTGSKTVLIGRISCESRSIVLLSLYIVFGG